MGRLIPESALWGITDSLARITETEALSKAEARQHALILIADKWQVPIEQITAEDDPTLYTILSKILRLVFPVSSFAGVNLARERARGAVRFNDALEIARGNAVTVAELETRRQTKETSPPERGIDLTSIARFVVVGARAAGYSDSEISAVIEDAIADNTST
jgi:hypothetical protein